MKKIMIAVISAFILCFTVACGVNAGAVYDKELIPAKDWDAQEPDYRYSCQYEYGYNPMTGKYEFANICKDRQEGWKTVHHHEDACYRLKFKNEDGDKGDDCVSVGKYDSVSIGDWYEK